MISQRKLDEIKTMKENGMSKEELSKELEVTLETVNRYLRLLRSTFDDKEQTTPKVLIFDIETAMMSVEVWGTYKQYISDKNIIEDWFCLGWAGKWLFDSKIVSDILTPKEATNLLNTGNKIPTRNDRRVIESVWKVMDEADLIIGHNSDKFDIRKLNARFLYYGLTPPSPYRTIDTIKVSKRNFSLSSYSLDYMCRYLGLNVKESPKYSLWQHCLQGNEKALSNMNTYNINDVVCTEELYLKLRPWIKSHPNMALHTLLDSDACPTCYQIETLQENGKYFTPAGRFKSYKCNNCLAFSRSRYSDLTKEERRNLLVSIAR